MNFPNCGERILVWIEGEWEIAVFRGPEAQGYAWDFDTWGLPVGGIEHWERLPESPEKSAASEWRPMDAAPRDEEKGGAG